MVSYFHRIAFLTRNDRLIPALGPNGVENFGHSLLCSNLRNLDKNQNMAQQAEISTQIFRHSKKRFFKIIDIFFLDSMTYNGDEKIRSYKNHSTNIQNYISFNPFLLILNKS